MKQYGVKIPVSGYTTIWIEAESEEAVQKAIDGEALNGNMYENSSYKDISKYAWCKVCNKRLFKLKD